MATTYDIGDTVTLSAVFGQDGVLVDPGTVTLVLRTPDRTSTTYTYAGGTVERDSLGTYSRDVLITLAGVHRYRWTSTGDAAASEESWFEVKPRRVP